MEHLSRLGCTYRGSRRGQRASGVLRGSAPKLHVYKLRVVLTSIARGVLVGARRSACRRWRSMPVRLRALHPPLLSQLAGASATKLQPAPTRHLREWRASRSRRSPRRQRGARHSPSLRPSRNGRRRRCSRMRARMRVSPALVAARRMQRMIASIEYGEENGMPHLQTGWIYLTSKTKDDDAVRELVA